MNAMTRAAKMLALMPVVALAAACNGVSPTSTTDLSRDLTADVPAAEATATATGLRNKACALVGGVNLQVVAEDKRAVTLQASYKYTEHVPVAQGCPAPVWASRDATLQVDRTNPFRVAVLRTHEGTVTVQAAAPNGVSDAITVNLARPRDTDGPATPDSPVPTNRPVPAPAPVNCKAISGVQVQVVQGRDTVALVTRYGFTAPGNECRVAPTWEANRKGLRVDPLNGFIASIPRATDATVVYVTAPNGVAAKVSF